MSQKCFAASRWNRVGGVGGRVGKFSTPASFKFDLILKFRKIQIPPPFSPQRANIYNEERRAASSSPKSSDTVSISSDSGQHSASGATELSPLAYNQNPITERTKSVQ